MNYEEYLKHYGVKGMKWGVRRDRSKGGTSGGQNESKIKTRVKEELGSLSRERQWKRQLSNMENMSTKELNQVANRIQMENNLKRLSRNANIATKEDKRDYRTRDKLSDKDLMERVGRLQAKDNLHRAVTNASKEQRELGMKIVKTTAAVGVKYALTGTVSTKDIGMAVLNPNKLSGDMKSKFRDSILDKYDKTLFERKN